MSINKISSDRLILIPFTLNFATSILKNQESDVIESMGLKTYNNWPDDETVEVLPKIVKSLELVNEPTGFESWMIVKQDSLAIIGDAGFKGMPNGNGEVDIGYAIIKEEQKKGYGFEAAKALTEWALLQPNVNYITASCSVNNTASIRILEKLGMLETSQNEEMIYWKIQKKILIS